MTVRRSAGLQSAGAVIMTSSTSTFTKAFQQYLYINFESTIGAPCFLFCNWPQPLGSRDALIKHRYQGCPSHTFLDFGWRNEHCMLQPGLVYDTSNFEQTPRLQTARLPCAKAQTQRRSLPSSRKVAHKGFHLPIDVTPRLGSWSPTLHPHMDAMSQASICRCVKIQVSGSASTSTQLTHSWCTVKKMPSAHCLAADAAEWGRCSSTSNGSVFLRVH